MAKFSHAVAVRFLAILAIVCVNVGDSAVNNATPSTLVLWDAAILAVLGIAFLISFETREPEKRESEISAGLALVAGAFAILSAYLFLRVETRGAPRDIFFIFLTIIAMGALPVFATLVVAKNEWTQERLLSRLEWEYIFSLGMFLATLAWLTGHPLLATATLVLAILLQWVWEMVVEYRSRKWLLPGRH